MTATATTLVTLGSSIPIRHNVFARNWRLIRCARISARISCGTVDSVRIEIVLKSAFQKYESLKSST